MLEFNSVSCSIYQGHLHLIQLWFKSAFFILFGFPRGFLHILLFLVQFALLQKVVFRRFPVFVSLCHLLLIEKSQSVIHTSKHLFLSETSILCILLKKKLSLIDDYTNAFRVLIDFGTKRIEFFLLHLQHNILLSVLLLATFHLLAFMVQVLTKIELSLSNELLHRSRRCVDSNIFLLLSPILATLLLKCCLI